MLKLAFSPVNFAVGYGRSLSAALFNRGIESQAPTRHASHSVMSSKPVIPKPPRQPQEKYDIEFNPKGGLRGWTDWRMKRDHRRRMTVVEYGCERTLLRSFKKQQILPREINEIAMKDLENLPRHSNWTRTHPRCAITSRNYGVVFRWRLSRLLFRHLADYNKLSGVRRGLW